MQLSTGSENQTLSTMQKFFLSVSLFLFSFIATAQSLIVQHNDKGLFITHTVTPKENFYSLGRLYNVPPKEIAAFNNLSMESGLNIGQTVQIPLIDANFSQSADKGQPVYYVVGEKEGLYRVSVNNNKVLMANLRKWNDLQSDNIAAGQQLIVGFLNSPGWSNTMTNIKKEEREPMDYAKIPEEKKEVIITKKDTAPVEQKVQKKEEVKSEPVKIVTAAVNDGSGGYFKPSFDAQVKLLPLSKDEMVTSGIFKTASGWQDAKYYALLDGVEPGTIIRVVNPNNNKAIYAKVLDRMSGIRQNQGFDLRISNAAATALDISDTEKFFVRVHY